MAEEVEGVLLSSQQGNTVDIKIGWREVPTVLADSVVGFVNVNNVPRVTLGQIVYAPDQEPKYLPVITVAASAESLRFIAAQFTQIANQIMPEGDNEQPTG